MKKGEGLGSEEYREYLVEEKKCGEYKDGDSFEIYNEGDEESGRI